MPSLFDCLQSAIDAQMVRNPSLARDAQSDFQQRVAQLATAYPLHVAQAMAAQQLKEARARGTASRRHAVLAQLMAAQRNTALISRARDAGLAVGDLMRSRQNGGNTFESVEQAAASYRQQFNGMMAEVLQTFHRDIAGRLTNAALVRDFVKEVHGEASGNAAAKGWAEAWRKTSTRMRTLFNAHGGDIGELADWGMAHRHEKGKIRAAGAEAWSREVFNDLAWERIEDASTGKPFAASKGDLPGDRAAATAFLQRVYKAITMDGWDGRAPSMGAGGKSLANRHAEHRVLHFKDADAWMRYNGKYGVSDPISTINDLIQARSREIALMRVLGPNPKAGLEHAAQVAQQRLQLDWDAKRQAAGTDPEKLRAVAAAQGKAEERLKARLAKARSLLRHAMGSNGIAEHEAGARFMAGTRKVVAGGLLGRAMLSSASDLWTMSTAGAAMGLNPKNIVGRHIELMASSTAREVAASAGYVADTLSDTGQIAARYMGEVAAPDMANTFVSGVLRAQGLAFWTDMARIAMPLEYGAELARNAHLGFDAMDPDLRRGLMSRGFTADDWDKLRDPAAIFTATDGSKFITPLTWLERSSLPRAEAESLNVRLGALFNEVAERGIPSGASWEVNAIGLGDTQPGTIIGEIARSGMMFKRYPIALTLNMIRMVQARYAERGLMSAAKYTVAIAAGLTVFGAVSLQLKQIAAGRDPLPMNTWSFWGRAMMQGGGLGIFGDFLVSSTNRFGNSWGSTLTGPAISLGHDVTKFAVGNTARLIQGEETFYARDGLRLLQMISPELWYFGPALERLFWEPLALFLDPGAEENMRRQERARLKEFGNRSWWERGEPTPNRLPDLTNAGDRP